MPARSLFIILVLLLMAAWPAGAAANACQEALLNINSSSEVKAGDCTEHFFDPKGITEVTDVGQMNGVFKSGGDIPALGYRLGKYWLRMRLRNAESQPLDVVISLANPMTRSARAWRLQGDGSYAIADGKSGAATSSRFEPVHRDTVLKISLPPAEPQIILVEAESIAQNYQPTVRSLRAYEHTVRFESIFFGFYFGIIAIMTVYNAALFIIVRDICYLAYAGTILFFHGLLFSTITGGTKYLLFGNEKIAMLHLPATTVIAFILALTFSMNFLNTKQTHPRIHKILNVVRFLFPAQFIALMINYHPTVVSFGVILQLTVFSLVILIALQNATQRNRAAQLFLAGWTLMLGGWFAWLLGQMGFYHHNFFSFKGMLLGSTIEVALFSFALGDKINSLRNEKDNALRRELATARERAHLEAEMLAANAVQETLLPNKTSSADFEIVSFYHAAEKIGGDWIWHSVDPQTGHLYAYIGDVTGHGVPSALMTGVICGATSALEHEFLGSEKLSSPKERLLRTAEVLNQVVAKTGSRSNRWVTMCLLCIEPDTGVLTYVNAGHPFPFIWRHANAAVESLAHSGSLLGSADGKFESYTTQLNENDVIMIYTDGFLEARDKVMHKKGRSRKQELHEMFESAENAARLKQLLVNKLQPVLEDQSLVGDDITFILIRRLSDVSGNRLNHRLEAVL